MARKSKRIRKAKKKLRKAVKSGVISKKKYKKIKRRMRHARNAAEAERVLSGTFQALGIVTLAFLLSPAD